MFKRLATIALVLLCTACISPKPDLQRLYRSATPSGEQPPVVVLHGILGAKLADESGKEVWPGSTGKVLFSDYRELRLPIDADTLSPAPSTLAAFAITDKAAGRDFYGALLRTLEHAGRYQRAEAGQLVVPGQRHYYVFVYDWRQDNALTAARLDQFIDQIRLDHENPDLRVDAIAHSMGGLVLRYFLRYGRDDVLDGNDFPMRQPGAEKVRRAVLLGTPNLGSVSALKGFLEGVPVGLRKIPTEVLATMPSVFQLLPHPLNEWIVAGDGTPLQRDLFDVELWRRFEWSIFNPAVRERINEQYASSRQADEAIRVLEQYFTHQLERARRFVWSMTVPVKDVQVRHVLFGGDCDLTPARILVEEVDGESLVRLWPRNIKHPVPGIDYDELMLEPGDGTVTKASLLARDSLDPSAPRHRFSFFPLDYSFFLCAKHNNLTGNIHFQNNLLHALLSRD